MKKQNISKAPDALNWSMACKKLKALAKPPEEVFSDEVAAFAAVKSYNRALSQTQSDQDDIALIILEQLTRDYPLFFEAAFLHAMVLSKAQKFSKAFKEFERAYNLTPDKSVRDGISYCVDGLRREQLFYRQQEEEQKNKSRKLSRVRAVMAKDSILQKADTSKAPNILASERAVARALEDDGSYELKTLKRSHFLSDFWYRYRFYIVCTGIAVILITGLMVFRQRRHLRQQQLQDLKAQEKLNYLTELLQQKSKDNGDIAKILSDFAAKYPEPTNR